MFTGVQKTFKIMSIEIEFNFIDVENKNDFIKVKHYVDEDDNDNEIMISGECSKQPYYIFLDIPTAIKFAKTLRTEINKAKGV